MKIHIMQSSPASCHLAGTYLSNPMTVLKRLFTIIINNFTVLH